MLDNIDMKKCGSGMFYGAVGYTDRVFTVKFGFQFKPHLQIDEGWSYIGSGESL